jgi:hypothetical protein
MYVCMYVCMYGVYRTILSSIFSDEKMELSLMNRPGLYQVYITHIEHVTENSYFLTVRKSSFCPNFAKQIMPILRIVCYNGYSITLTILSLTATKFKPFWLRPLLGLVRVRFTLRLVVYRKSVLLGDKPLENHDQ